MLLQNFFSSDWSHLQKSKSSNVPVVIAMVKQDHLSFAIYISQSERQRNSHAISGAPHAQLQLNLVGGN